MRFAAVLSAVLLLVPLAAARGPLPAQVKDGTESPQTASCCVETCYVSQDMRGNVETFCFTQTGSLQRGTCVADEDAEMIPGRCAPADPGEGGGTIGGRGPAGGGTLDADDREDEPIDKSRPLSYRFEDLSNRTAVVRFRGEPLDGVWLEYDQNPTVVRVDGADGDPVYLALFEDRLEEGGTDPATPTRFLRTGYEIESRFRGRSRANATRLPDTTRFGGKEQRTVQRFRVGLDYVYRVLAETGDESGKVTVYSVRTRTQLAATDPAG